MKVSEDEKNKVKQELDVTNKQLSDKTAAEMKAKEDVTKLTNEKVIIRAVKRLICFSRVNRAINYFNPALTLINALIQQL